MNRSLALALVAMVWGACKPSDKAPPAPSVDAEAPPVEAKAPPVAPKATPPVAGKVSPPKREATKAEVQATIKDLTAKVKTGVMDPTNPWAMAHGLLVFGKSMKTTDKRLAIDVMVSDFAIRARVDNHEVYAFPDKAADGTPVDPHGNMIVKSLVEAGVKPSHRFKLRTGKKITLKRLIDDVEHATIIPSANQDWHRFAWTHQVLMSKYDRGDAADTKTGKKTMLEFALRSVHELEEHQQELARLMEAHTPELLSKDRTGIYAHPCGGLHFVQSTVKAAKHQDDEIMLRRVREQLDVVLFRWEGERRLYKSIAAQRPDARLLIYVQELKFYGHVLETFGLAEEWGVLKPSDTQKKILREVAADLIDAIKGLEVAFTQLDKVKETSAQTYYDLLGDGCHAIRGLRLALVSSFAN